jgi:hypothetical protein
MRPDDQPPWGHCAMNAIFDDMGVRFEYPPDWEIEISEDGTRTTVAIQAAEGPGFALVSLDADCPDPEEMAEEALEAMSAEYAGLEARLVVETIDGHEAVGYDAEFLSFDMPSSCAIRCFRTPRRAVLIFQQWTDLDDSPTSDQMRALRLTLEETDA